VERERAHHGFVLSCIEEGERKLERRKEKEKGEGGQLRLFEESFVRARSKKG